MEENHDSSAYQLKSNCRERSNGNMRASQPYAFMPKNGAPSMKGKMITRASNKMRDSM